MFHVYVLVSESTGVLYIGQTTELPRRLAEHNNPATNPREHTGRNTGPRRLVRSDPYSSRPEAMCCEKWLTSGIGRPWVDATLGRAGLPQAE
jgi:predicted GIY-YIG superfamily endonuclease